MVTSHAFSLTTAVVALEMGVGHKEERKTLWEGTYLNPSIKTTQTQERLKMKLFALVKRRKEKKEETY